MKPLATTWCTYYAGFAEQPPDELLDIGFLNEEYRSRPFYYPMAKGNIRGFPPLNSGMTMYKVSAFDPIRYPFLILTPSMRP